MKRVLVVSVVTAVLAGVSVPMALGKGATEATLEGPGLSGSIHLAGSGEPGSGEQLGLIAEESGFYPAVFGQSPDPMLAERPTGDLGPRYTITYVMPGPNDEEDELVQHVYPYAQPAPVTYVEPGQRFWTTERTRGGWFVASYTSLKDNLVAAGLPGTAPVSDGNGGGDGVPWLPVVLIALGAVVALVVVAALRRRPRPVTAS